MKEQFWARDDFQNLFEAWWRKLSGTPVGDEQEHFAPNRGQRAELRRARSSLDVCLTQAFAGNLIQYLKKYGYVPSSDEIEPLARLAGLASHVETYEKARRMGALMAYPALDSTRVAVAPQRFRKFLLIKNPDELYTAFVRVLQMTDRKANLKDLSRACFQWNDETRRWWALEYYAQLPKDQSEYES